MLTISATWKNLDNKTAERISDALTTLAYELQGGVDVKIVMSDDSEPPQEKKIIAGVTRRIVVDSLTGVGMGPWRVSEGDKYVEALCTDECLFVIASVLLSATIPYRGFRTKEEHDAEEAAREKRRLEPHEKLLGDPNA